MKKKAAQAMSTDLITVSLSDSLADAYNIIRKHKFRHLPVINDDTQKIIGILSDRDLKRAMKTYDSKKFEFDPEESISKYMTTAIKTVPADAELADVVKIMRDEKISSVLISENESITGIITTDDLLSIFLNVDQKDRESFLHSAVNWLYRKPVNEIAFQLAQIGV